MWPVVAAALLAAAIVTIAGQRTHDACARPEGLYETGVIPGSSPGVENETKAVSMFQRTEGEVEGTPLRYSVLRAYRPGKITREPVSYASTVMIADRSELGSRDVDGIRLPVHFATNQHARGVTIAAYTFVFDGRPVDRILRHRLATFWDQLVYGRYPLTLLLVWGMVHPGDVAEQREVAEQWLADAWRFYARTCAP